jgi:transcriptional regulator GlxA family with amidase domain
MLYEFSGAGRARVIRAALDRGLERPPDWRVERILRFVGTQSGKLGWDLHQLCAQLQLGISGSHAAKLFNQQIGIGIREYAKQQRLMLAARLLQATRHSVKYVAFELGYRTPNDLRRQFERMFCLTPTEFRTADRQRLTLKRTSTADLPVKVDLLDGGVA